MNSIKFAILSIVLGVSSLSIGQEGDFDLEKITTSHGRVYRDILILNADKHGMLFRHRTGIAKVGYGQLSMNLRMLYEPVSEGIPEEVEGEPDPLSELQKDGLAFEQPSDLVLDEPLLVTARSRVTVPVRNCYLNMLYSHSCRQPVHWPVHWSRYHPGHALAFPACRELAVRDFLYTTHLLPKPPGVFTYALPRHGPYGFRY